MKICKRCLNTHSGRDWVCYNCSKSKKEIDIITSIQAKCLSVNLNNDPKIINDLKLGSKYLCVNCKEVFCKSLFRDRKCKNSNNYYKQSICKKCETQKTRIYEKENPEQVANMKKAWKSKNIFYKRKTNQAIKNPQKYIYNHIKASAKNRNLEFNLEIDDIVIPEICPYLNIPIKFNFYDKLKDDSISVDRIDNTKGYVKGNIQLISNKANRCKSNLSINELIFFAKKILELHKEDDIVRTANINEIADVKDKEL